MVNPSPGTGGCIRLWTKKAVETRRGWAQENAEQDWHRVIFTDEAAIELDEQRIQYVS